MAEGEQSELSATVGETNGEDDQLFTQDPDVGFEQAGTDSQGVEGGDTIGDDANEDDDHRKIFVGGLSRDTSSADLKKYFSKYGEVTKCELKTDLESGRSRGFGFIVFKDTASIDKVLEAPEHVLDGKTIDPKKANPKKREPNLKVFVGGLNTETPESEIRSHFEKFGTIVDLELPLDQNEKRRGFCFVSFQSEDVVKKVVEKRMQTIGGKEVEVKKSVPRQDFRRGGYRGGWYGGYPSRRGRGRGWNQGYGYGYGNYNQGYGGYNHNYGSYNQGYGGYDNYYGYNHPYNSGGWGGSYDQGYSSYGNYG